MKLIRATLLLVLVVISANFNTLAEETVQFPLTVGGQRASEYLKTYNSGDEQAMLKFFERNFAPQALKSRSADQRIQIYREMRTRLQTLELRKILSSDDTTFSCLLQSKTGDWLNLTFLFDNTPAHMLLGIRIEDVEAPDDSQPDTPLTQSELVSELGRYLDSLLATDEFSGTVLLAHNGIPFFNKACGLASKEFNVPNALDTKFNLGSINKIFTQVAICQLVEQKKLSFNDLLGKWLPNYPNQEARQKVTIQHLLAMSSGIGDFFGERFDAIPKDRLRTNSDYLSLFADQPLLFEPGTRREYSNGGYIVLGTIIEKVTGRSYYDYIQEHIFRPAGMNNTEWYHADVPVPNLAIGYTLTGIGINATKGTRVNNIYTRPARGSSAGGGYSTVEDLLRFAKALEECTLLSPLASRWILERDFDDKTAIGATQKTANKKHLTQGYLGIAGGAPGINAVLDADFVTGYVSIVMSNYDPPTAVRVAKKIRGLLSRLKS